MSYTTDNSLRLMLDIIGSSYLSVSLTQISLNSHPFDYPTTTAGFYQKFINMPSSMTDLLFSAPLHLLWLSAISTAAISITWKRYSQTEEDRAKIFEIYHGSIKCTCLAIAMIMVVEMVYVTVPFLNRNKEMLHLAAE